jgi:orotate phosphoribosyltransferase
MEKQTPKSITKSELAQQVFDCAHLTGSFLLRSGKTSTEYFDKYQFESNPKLLAEIARHLSPLVPKDTDYLAALEMGGIPIATAISLATGIPVVFVRKEAKDYGTCKFAEGPPIGNKKLCLIEDVITTGGQVIISAQDLRTDGAHIDTVLCVIDRSEGQTQKIKDAGIKHISLFTMAELKTAGDRSPVN